MFVQIHFLIRIYLKVMIYMESRNCEVHLTFSSILKQVSPLDVLNIVLISASETYITYENCSVDLQTETITCSVEDCSDFCQIMYMSFSWLDYLSHFNSIYAQRKRKKCSLNNHWPWDIYSLQTSVLQKYIR